MKHLLLLSIKIYWFAIPKKLRRSCLFSESCSNHVFRITKDQGFSKGIKALKERYQNCRQGYQYIEIKGETFLLSKTQKLYKPEEIKQ